MVTGPAARGTTGPWSNLRFPVLWHVNAHRGCLDIQNETRKSCSNSSCPNFKIDVCGGNSGADGQGICVRFCQLPRPPATTVPATTTTAFLGCLSPYRQQKHLLSNLCSICGPNRRGSGLHFGHTLLLPTPLLLQPPRP